MSELIGLDGVRMTMTIIRRDGVMLELIHPESPPSVGTAEPTPLNQLGFTHLALWVDDVDAAAQGVVAYGGKVIEAQRAEFDQDELRARFQMCTDPDGVRIELIEYPDGQAAVVGR